MLIEVSAAYPTESCPFASWLLTIEFGQFGLFWVVKYFAMRRALERTRTRTNTIPYGTEASATRGR